MKKTILFTITPVLLLTSVFFISLNNEISEDYEPILTSDSLIDDTAFTTMMDVISHPRCINCHPNDNIPKRGMEGIPHPYGRDGATSSLSFDTLLCASCHKEENDNFAGQPGAPHWDLAPKSMAWQGLSRTEIAKSMLNTENNGNRSKKEIIKHLTEDELVLWAFNPGNYQDGTPREKPPVSEEDFKAAVKKWFADGAVIPNE